MLTKTVVEETREICTLCRGCGQRSSDGQSTAVFVTCPGCMGAGLMLTKTVRRTEECDVDELTDAISQRLTDHLKRGRPFEQT